MEGRLNIGAPPERPPDPPAPAAGARGEEEGGPGPQGPSCVGDEAQSRSRRPPVSPSEPSACAGGHPRGEDDGLEEADGGACLEAMAGSMVEARRRGEDDGLEEADGGACLETMVGSMVEARRRRRRMSWGGVLGSIGGTWMAADLRGS